MGCLDDGCDTGLVLGLGLTPTPPAIPDPAAAVAANKINSIKPVTAFEPSMLSLGLHPTCHPRPLHKKGSGDQDAAGQPDVYLPASPHSVVSSFSSGRVKRERDMSSEETEVERVSSRVSEEEEEDGGNNARKKLRLTKEQSALLEESFKQHSTLNPKQKQALARQLNLRPRQVEVWFQNRRARTKLKQTEVDCEFLKKCCETLTDENRRLQKELQELKALKLAQPLYMHMPAATLTMCPSCERIGGGDGGAPKGGALISMAQKSHFFNPFPNPSAAC